jgi:TolA-binding protein
MVVVTVPVAAVLVASSAWAAVTGHLPRWIDRFLRPEETHAIVDPASKGALPPAPVLVATMPTSSPSADVPSPPAAEAIVASPEPSTAPARHLVGGSTSAPPASSAAGAEETLYAAAHHAHFVARDPAAALKGWDAYLAAYPRGRFTLEARYNRGLSLVRLGRTAEASAALAPFADGTLGGYRQREARELLDALDVGP